MATKTVLHSENLKHVPLSGRLMRRALKRRSSTIQEQVKDLTDPDVTILIRTQNNMAYIKELFKDIKAQIFDGKIEIIVVDTESSDGTDSLAHSQGAKVITISQADFTYPRSLNIGFEAASHPYVLTLVGHSNLASPYLLKSLTLWSQNPNFGGIYGVTLPNWNASITERLLYSLVASGGLGQPRVMRKDRMGLLGANCSIIKRSVWKKLRGYDERFASGGEDSALGRSMLSTGLLVVREPLCSVYHVHGLGPINLIRQYLHWRELSKPGDFETDKVWKRRPDLRPKI